MIIQDTIKKLIDSGTKEKEIAFFAQTTIPTINRIKLGKHKSCSYEIGKKIIDLAKKKKIKIES